MKFNWKNELYYKLAIVLIVLVYFFCICKYQKDSEFMLNDHSELNKVEGIRSYNIK